MNSYLNPDELTSILVLKKNSCKKRNEIEKKKSQEASWILVNVPLGTKGPMTGEKYRGEGYQRLQQNDCSS